MNCKFLFITILDYLYIGTSLYLSMISTTKSTKLHQIHDLVRWRSITDSYEPREFIPPNFLFRLGKNCHFQTIFGSGVIKDFLNRALTGKPLSRNFNTIGKRMYTPDGDFFDIEISQENMNSDSLVIILHGKCYSLYFSQIIKFSKSYFFMFL